MLKYTVIAGIVVLVAAAALFAGCANTIHPPVVPGATRNMYLLDLGRHTRLAFGLPDGGFVEYGYGEWQWYAKMEDQWWRAPVVLFSPTQGTLGRRHWRGRGAETRLLKAYAGLNVLELPAAPARVDALVANLDRKFAQHSQHLVHNSVYGLDFVPVDDPYTLCNNSNHAVKRWLEQAGYTVSGLAVFAHWKLEENPAP